jgi:hypothetical protein
MDLHALADVQRTERKEQQALATLGRQYSGEEEE